MPKRLPLRRFRRGERQLLQAKLHDRKLPAWAMHRYQIIAYIRDGQSAFRAAHSVGCSAKAAYLWLARFNTSGFASFEESSNPEGRPSKLMRQQLNLLYQTARKRPTDVGLPFTHWSMTKLQDYLVKKHRFPKVGPEWLRQLLRRANISWQRTKTWKQSDDPEFERKKSVFWHFTPDDRSTEPWFVTINWGRWNSVPSPECVGLPKVNRSDIGPHTRVSRASNNCMGFTTFMQTV